MDWSLITQLPLQDPDTQMISYDLVSWIAVKCCINIIILFINTVLNLVSILKIQALFTPGAQWV